MQQIPLQTIPSQQLQIVLGGQNCQINVYLKRSQIYVDLYSNGIAISTGVIALNQVALVPTTYFGFEGNLMFFDTQGSNDPVYTGFGNRYLLLYIVEADFPSLS